MNTDNKDKNKDKNSNKIIIYDGGGFYEHKTYITAINLNEYNEYRFNGNKTFNIENFEDNIKNIIHLNHIKKEDETELNTLESTHFLYSDGLCLEYFINNISDDNDDDDFDNDHKFKDEINEALDNRQIQNVTIYYDERKAHIKDELIVAINKNIFRDDRAYFYTIGMTRFGYNLERQEVVDYTVPVDINYGSEFKDKYDILLNKLDTSHDGLFLLWGEPGTGKCVVGDTNVTIRTKITNEIEEISIIDFYNSLPDSEYIDDTIDDTKKIINSKDIKNYEILTDSGFQDVIALHKTIEYEIFKVKTKDFELHCADNHILFLENDEEIYVKNLSVGQKIKTENGIQEITSIEKTIESDNMYDFELGGKNVKYYTNGILSHNTTLIRKLIKDVASNKKIIYIPSFMISHLSKPEFIGFLKKYKNMILLLEDAEHVIQDRNNTNDSGAVSNILNMTDGLLNDIIKVQIIATFNTKRENIDKALLREGRLKFEHEFTKLSKEDAQIVVDNMKIEYTVDDDMSLAQIYNLKDYLERKEDQGINKSERRQIGFQKD